MYLLYSFLLALGLIVSSPYWIYRALREKKYLANFLERLGLRVPSSIPDRPLWIHAVSVGEVLAAKPLLSAVRDTLPDLSVVVSTVTLTGMELARRECAAAQALFYFPFDWGPCVRRYLGLFKPRAVVLMETELWPNFLRQCDLSRTPVFLANGRISDKSWRTYRLLPGLVRTMLRGIRFLGVQTAEDKRRFVDLGAPEEQIAVTGSMKFDQTSAPVEGNNDLLGDIRRHLGAGEDGPLIVIGSSMRGEEILFLNAFTTLRRAVPGAKLVLAPRHPERFAEVADLISRSGLPFVRRSDPTPSDIPADVFLLDSIGELRAVYALAAVAVIGGSFLPFGGHNLLEPAALGKAVVIGPEMTNFKEMTRIFLQEQAVRQCSIESLPRELESLLLDRSTRELLGTRALKTYRASQGATERTLRMIVPYLE